MTKTSETFAELKAKLYPVRVYFTRRFVRGNLKGMIHNDSLGFTDNASAQDWILGIKANSKAGKLDYELADYAFQKYWRD